MCLLLWRSPGGYFASDSAFFGVAQANTNPVLQKVRTVEAPKLAAHQDAIYLNAKLFCSRGGCLQTARVAQTRSRNRFGSSMSLTIGSSALAQTSPTPDQNRVEKLNEGNLDTRATPFRQKLLPLRRTGLYVTPDQSALAE